MSTKVDVASAYNHALKLLRSKRRLRRPDKDKSLLRNPGHSSLSSDVLRGTPSCDGMRNWLRQIGHRDSTIDNLRVIHVAGTKGKGSTCAFSEALLGAHKRRTGFPETYGMYSSPALHEERERIRVNSSKLSKEQFAESTLEVWNALKLDTLPTDSPPRFLQLLFLICVHSFIKADVRVAIVETHHGGQFDSTNIFHSPVAAAVTSLGMDHVDQLGPTIQDIAWHKAGIFKPLRPALSLEDQPQGTHEVLRRRALELRADFQYIPKSSHLDHPVLSPPVQQLNFSMALALVQTYLDQHAEDCSHRISEEEILQALDSAYLPGRFQRIAVRNIDWFLDGAHNSMSIGKPISWFAEATASRPSDSGLTQCNASSKADEPYRILAFSHISSERDGEELTASLIHTIKDTHITFDCVIFCYDGIREDGSLKSDKNFGHSIKNHRYAEMWHEAGLPGFLVNVSTIAEVLEHVQHRSLAHRTIHVLATGSFHLVGGILADIQP